MQTKGHTSVITELVDATGHSATNVRLYKLSINILYDPKCTESEKFGF